MLAVIAPSLPAGLAAAVAAAVCYETSYVLQALEARKLDPALALRPALLTTLARRWRWLAGIALAVAGFGLQVVALVLAPLTVVQPVLALGLVLLLLLGVRVLGETVGPREALAVGAVIAGCSCLALVAPERTNEVGSRLGLGLALAVLVTVALTPYLVRRAFAARGAVLVLAAGAADVVAALAAKLASDRLSAGHALAAVGWAIAAGVVALVGLSSETTALQRLPATRVGPVIVVVQITLPVVFAPLLAGEDWGSTPLGGAAIVAALALVAGGAAVLAGSPLAGGLAAAERSAARETLEHDAGGRG